MATGSKSSLGKSVLYQEFTIAGKAVINGIKLFCRSICCSCKNQQSFKITSAHFLSEVKV